METMVVTVSVIIPVFEVVAWLDEAIASVAVPADVAAEVIVIDDGSAEPVTPTEPQDPRVTVRLLRQEHAGAAAARNHGLAHAQGSVIMFLDADDRWAHDKVARQLRLISQEPGVVHCGWLQEFSSLPDDNGSSPHERLLTGPSLVTAGVTRDIAHAIGPLAEDLRAGEGIDWFLRAEALGIPVRMCPEVLAYRRIHQGNRDRRRRSDSLDYLTVIRRHRGARAITSEGIVPPPEPGSRA
jgi:glycosyltransferase involved in cell wall biosynthesis